MKVWISILTSMVFCLSLFANKENNRLYLKPKTIIGVGEVRLSEFTNWKGNWNPIVFRNVKAPIIISPESLTDTITTLYSKEFGVETSFEVMGKEGILLPRTSNASKKELEDSLWKALSLSNQNGLGEMGENFRIQSEKESFPIISGTSPVWRSLGRSLHPGKRLFPLDFYFEGKLVHSESIPFLIEEKKKAYFTTKEIPAKTVLTENDVELRSFFSADSFREFTEENPVGKTALNGFLPDTAIEKKQVRTLHTIERGQEVELVYTTGNLLLKIKTRALSSGNQGEEIPLLNLATQKTIKARVQNEGVCLLEER
ncbi:flagellar basal body P-ring formation protein FlgA [Leptospira levettii]|uniref:Flagellar basal body P-ring formation protein FlgA n=1 Tax=Leptospira levettii TaxID=2023178 RepID=A0ABY2MHZ0_9LEPT|nr:flagellar basal body P-ring formation chaperone FlgA [Leptospira levettii]PKA24983.1 flagella basal body P-ring formation protein FlgA [Leptospira sp. mixed culture ATI2-C-A1]TGL67103.1 flagellar basal body P-ring formation protein FlgA [Leptospira levettii]TGM28396.1 flagellar basal body P-ring formation protein FlgA [Leptospira levettii]TGM43359.1 flagellar basal body P-ring formation protein FlgA [Leptospira levettii]TGM78458.1 flagellar basal body P-ring formation protein FlgA [Leptospi